MDQLIEVKNDDVTINCPSCDNWEVINIDQPRHKLHSFYVCAWEYNKDSTSPEVSLVACHGCKTDFRLIWDYKNKVSLKKTKVKMKVINGVVYHEVTEYSKESLQSIEFVHITSTNEVVKMDYFSQRQYYINIG